MVLDDCTVAAQGAGVLIGLWQAKSPEYVRRLLTEQRPVWQDTVRITTEWVATGRYPIGLGVSEPELTRLQNDGVGRNVKPLEYGGGNMAASGVAVFRNAPHPNAAKVFVNWLVSREGQAAHVRADANAPAHPVLLADREYLGMFADSLLGRPWSVRAPEDEDTVLPEVRRVWKDLWTS